MLLSLGVLMSSLGKFLKSRAQPLQIRLNQRKRNKKPNAETRMRLSGRVANVQVLEQDGTISFETGGFDNLILDQGLNLVATNLICDLFKSCAVGTGNTVPNVLDVGLNAEYARTANYLTGAGNCGTTRASVTQWVMRRTFDFPSPASNQNFAELGFSPTATAGANLFSRVQIKSGGIPTAVTVLTTQSLRVVYELTVNFSNVDQNFNASFGGTWGVITGIGRLQNTTPNTPSQPINSILTTGLNDQSPNFAALEPSYNCNVVVSDTLVALNAIGTGSAMAGTTVSLTSTPATYTAGSFFRDRSVTYLTTQANQTINTIYLVNLLGNNNPAWAFRFSSPQTKTSLATLTLTIRISWGR
jgi:hypothetical protein